MDESRLTETTELTEPTELTEQECLDVLASARAARLAVTRRGAPYIELVGLIHLDGEPIVLLPETSAITHLLAALVSPRRLVVLQTDDLSEGRQSVRSVTALARPRWVVDPAGLDACRRAAAVRGFAVSADAWFLALTRPTLVGRRVPLGARTAAPAPAGQPSARRGWPVDRNRSKPTAAR